MNSAFDDDWATMATNHFLEHDTFVESARAFATTAYNRHLQAAGKTIFVDKTPRYYHILGFVETLFPKARKIWLKRNPLDVALSYVNSWGVRPEIISGQEVTTSSFDFAIGPFNLAAYFDKPSARKLEVHYEQLVSSPPETAATVCDFLGVDFEEEMLHYAHSDAMLSEYTRSIVGDADAPATPSVHRRSVGRWSTELSPLEIQQIVQLLGFDIFRRMGYQATVDTLRSIGIVVSSEAEAAEARRRVGATSIDRTAQLYDELAALRRHARAKRAIALMLKKTRIDQILSRLLR